MRTLAFVLLAIYAAASSSSGTASLYMVNKPNAYGYTKIGDPASRFELSWGRWVSLDNPKSKIVKGKKWVEVTRPHPDDPNWWIEENSITAVSKLKKNENEWKIKSLCYSSGDVSLYFFFSKIGGVDVTIYDGYTDKFEESSGHIFTGRGVAQIRYPSPQYNKVAAKMGFDIENNVLHPTGLPRGEKPFPCPDKEKIRVKN